MEEQGYERSWSAALVSVAGVLAMLIPPIALNLYTAASVANVPSTKVFRKVIPFLIGITIPNIITVYVRQRSTFLPDLFYK